MDGLYEEDFYPWTREQAAAGRARANAIDWEHLAEEIESSGNSDRRELSRRLGTIIEHLAKLEWSPAVDPRV